MNTTFTHPRTLKPVEVLEQAQEKFPNIYNSIESAIALKMDTTPKDILLLQSYLKISVKRIEL